LRELTAVMTKRTSRVRASSYSTFFNLILLLLISVTIPAVATASLSSSGKQTTVAERNPGREDCVATSDHEILRSLGLSGIEIETLFGEDVKKPDQDVEADESSGSHEDEDENLRMDNVPFSMSVQDAFDGYNAYDSYEYDSDNDDLNEEEIKIVDLPHTQKKDVTEEYMMDNDWWKDPLKSFTEGADGKTKVDKINFGGDIMNAKNGKSQEKMPQEQTSILSDTIEDEAMDRNGDKPPPSETPAHEPSISTTSEDPSMNKTSDQKSIRIFAQTESRAGSEPQSTTAIVGSIFNLIPALMVSKVGGYVNSCPPPLRIAIIVAFGKRFSRILSDFQSFIHLKRKQQQRENLSIHNSEIDSEREEEDYNDESLEDLGFGRPRQSLKTNEFLSFRHPSDKIFLEEQGDGLTAEKEGDRGWWRAEKRNKLNEVTSKSDKTETVGNSKGWGIFGIRNRMREMKQMVEELDHLKEQCKEVELARDKYQLDWEDSSRELEASHRELDELNKTNGYLKAQLRDNKKIFDRTVNEEGQKMNLELARVRNSMVSVLERERRIMTNQIMKVSSEVRSMMFNEETDVDENSQYKYETGERKEK